MQLNCYYNKLAKINHITSILAFLTVKTLGNTAFVPLCQQQGVIKTTYDFC